MLVHWAINPIVIQILACWPLPWLNFVHFGLYWVVFVRIIHTLSSLPETHFVVLAFTFHIDLVGGLKQLLRIEAPQLCKLRHHSIKDLVISMIQLKALINSTVISALNSIPDLTTRINCIALHDLISLNQIRFNSCCKIGSRPRNPRWNIYRLFHSLILIGHLTHWITFIRMWFRTRPSWATSRLTGYLSPDYNPIGFKDTFNSLI